MHPVVLILLSPILVPLILVFLLLYSIFHFATTLCCCYRCCSGPTSVPVGEPASENETAPYRRAGFEDALTIAPSDNVRVVGDIWRASVEKYGDRPCFYTRAQYYTHFKGDEFDKERVSRGAKAQTEEGKEAPKKRFELKVQGDWSMRTYADVNQRILAMARGFSTLPEENRPSTAAPVNIFMDTSEAWTTTAMYAFASGIPISTSYATLGVSGLAYALRQTECAVLVTSSDHVATVLAAVREENVTSLRTIVYVPPQDTWQDKDSWFLENGKKTATWSDACEFDGVSVISMRYIIEAGSKGLPSSTKEVTEEVSKLGAGAQPEDIAVIMYTSGSTGNPKGVEITQGSICSVVGGFLHALPTVNETDRYLAYLPLAHIFEMGAEIAMLSKGVALGFSHPRSLTSQTSLDTEGNPSGDISSFGPSVLCAVPLVLDKIAGGLRKGLAQAGCLKRCLFNMAYCYKRRNASAGWGSWLWDKILFSKIKARFGGRLKLIISGSAPLSANTQEFVSTVVAPVMQGYGATETCAASNAALLGDPHPRHVGPPVPCSQIKLVSVPSLGYSVQDKPNPRGEIWVGGRNVARGYFKMPEKTKSDFHDLAVGQASPFESSGEEKVGVADQKEDANADPEVPKNPHEVVHWFKTGDVGEIDSSGNLRIIDRIKSLIKLRGGEYVALESLESKFRRARGIENIMVIANGDIRRVKALISPDPEEIPRMYAELCGDSEGKYTELADMVKDPAVVGAMLAEIQQIGKNLGLARMEIPDKIAILPDIWTIEEEHITPSRKLKRKNLLNAFKAEVADLCADS